MKRFIPIFLSLVLVLSLCVPVAYADETEIDESLKIIIADGQEYEISGTRNAIGGYFYVDENTPLSYEWMELNPDFSFKIEFVSGNGKYNIRITQINAYLGDGIDYNYNWFSTRYQSDASKTYPLTLKLAGDVTTTIKLTFTGIPLEDTTSGGNAGTEPSEPSEPTEEPTVPPVDDGSDTEDSNFIIDALKDFFTNLFKPILDWLTATQKYLEGFQGVGDMIEDNPADFNFITEFFSNLNLGAVDLVLKIWELPIIKELSIGFVGLLVISGIFILLTTF